MITIKYARPFIMIESIVFRIIACRNQVFILIWHLHFVGTDTEQQEMKAFNGFCKSMSDTALTTDNRAISRFYMTVVLLLAFTAGFNKVYGQQSVPLKHISYPKAEYNTAQVILMHTPGNETVVTRSYGTNNLATKQEEHLQLMDVLRQNHIKVFELTDVLMTIPTDSLKKMVSNPPLTPPDGSGTTIDNKWEKADIIQYIIEHPPLRGLYYTRDQSITTPRGEVICKMFAAHRNPEPGILEQCYQYLGAKVFYKINGRMAKLEGGDYIPFCTLSFIGEGLRTNRFAIEELMQADAIGHDTLVVVKDGLRKGQQMHLDTYFNIIDKDLVVLSATRLNAHQGERAFISADVYTRKPGETTYHLDARNISFTEFLTNRGIKIIPVSDPDIYRLACNFICIGPHHIIAREGLSEDFKQSLKENKVQTEWVKIDELVKGGGGIHCLTQVISRK